MRLHPFLLSLPYTHLLPVTKDCFHKLGYTVGILFSLGLPFSLHILRFICVVVVWISGSFFLLLNGFLLHSYITLIYATLDGHLFSVRNHYYKADTDTCIHVFLWICVSFLWKGSVIWWVYVYVSKKLPK